MCFSSIPSIRFAAMLVLVLAVLSGADHPAHAQEKSIPDDLLALDHQRCMTGCVPGFGEQTCKPLCSCTVSEFKKRMSFEAYLDVSVELARNEVGPETRKILDSIALYCADQIEKAGIEVGEAPGAQADAPQTPEKPDKPD